MSERASERVSEWWFNAVSAEKNVQRSVFKNSKMTSALREREHVKIDVPNN